MADLKDTLKTLKAQYEVTMNTFAIACIQRAEVIREGGLDDDLGIIAKMDAWEALIEEHEELWHGLIESAPTCSEQDHLEVRKAHDLQIDDKIDTFLALEDLYDAIDRNITSRA